MTRHEQGVCVLSRYAFPLFLSSLFIVFDSPKARGQVSEVTGTICSTHGVYRPFLPGMVQKNSDIEVADHTTNAVKVLSPLSPSQTKKEITIIIISALDRVCKLKGVGPATGTLVLSVFKPDVVPFFQDELFAWLIPEHSAKLKYDKKEYGMLLDRALDIVLEKNIEADKLEKTAYVLMHADLLTKEQKQQLLSSDEKSELDSIEQPRGHQTSEDGDDDQSKEHKKVHQSQVKPVPKSRKAAVEEDESSLRRSKRRKA